MRETQYLVGTFTDAESAHQAVAAIIDNECPEDQISVLALTETEGKDVLGITHPDVRGSIKNWASQGAFWGAAGGLIVGAAGAAGIVWMPVVGHLLAAGHLSTAVTGGAMGVATGSSAGAGASAASQSSLIRHRNQFQQADLKDLQYDIESGRYLVVVQTEDDESRYTYRGALSEARPESIKTLM